MVIYLIYVLVELFREGKRFFLHNIPQRRKEHKTIFLYPTKPQRAQKKILCKLCVLVRKNPLWKKSFVNFVALWKKILCGKKSFVNFVPLWEKILGEKNPL